MSDRNLGATPRISIIVGSAGLRRLVATWVRCHWRDARVEEVDPFSETISVVTPAVGAYRDVAVMGGIGTAQEAIMALKRLRSHRSAPPIVLIVAATLLPSAAALVAAGAHQVLDRESLNAARLIAAVTAALHHDAVQSPRRDGVEAVIELIIAGQRHLARFDGYDDLTLLSASPMTQVLNARAVASQLRVVIKVLLASPLHEPTMLAMFCERYTFLTQAQSRHLVTYLNAGIVASWPYVVIEYLPDGDLRQRMAAGLTAAATLRILSQLASALETLHAGGFAHLDVKPENIFFRADGTLVLIDYNIAARFGAASRHRLTGEVLGTPTYMSPEQGQGLIVDGRSDLYSAGVILFEALAGHPPFAGENTAQVLLKHIHDEIPLLPRGLRRLQALLDRLLEKRPEDRFASAAELKAAIESLLLLTDFSNDE